MVSVKAIKAITVILSGHKVGARCTEDGGLSLNPIGSGAVVFTLEAETVSDFYLQHLDARLLNSQVCHLDVQAMEVDSLNTLVDSASKPAFTNVLNALAVGDGAELMELTEEVVELVKGA